MRTYTVHFKTVASTVVNVELTDEDLAAVAAETGVAVEDLPDDYLESIVTDKAYEADMPTLCAHCSGMFRGPGLDLGDAWEINGVDRKEG